jgi:hypothetical protein
MKLLTYLRLAAAFGAAFVALAESRLDGNDQPFPPFPAPMARSQKAEAARPEEQAQKGQEVKEGESKEEEPVTPAEKLKKEEIEKKACPKIDVKFSADTDKTTHPTPEPPPDKALVYVVRPTMLGNKIQTKLAVDGKWVGVNRGHNYFFLNLDPGEHYFCSKAENTSVLAVKVEAGKTYYVEQKIKEGFLKARNKLALLPETEGKKKLAESHPSSWQEEK